MLTFRLSPWRAARLEEALAEKEEEARTNRDFRPVGFLYDLAQWSAQFPGPLRYCVGKIIAAGPVWAYSVPVVLLLLMAAGSLAWRQRGATPRGGDNVVVRRAERP